MRWGEVAVTKVPTAPPRECPSKKQAPTVARQAPAQPPLHSATNGTHGPRQYDRNVRARQIESDQVKAAKYGAKGMKLAALSSHPCSASTLGAPG
ncbi:MAG: hypothetical protein CM1200mP41_18380 [Gammaproteobacteria bacterium]|nr:MAG: hypothetical protein CM1200mP41_18380 [Gammaproteobacteria bacterium]